MAEKEKVVYSKPTSQVDLEARLKNGNAAATLTDPINPGMPDVEAGNLYVGTDPIYQNHANDTEAPLQADKGVERKAEENFLSSYDKPELNVKRRKQLEDGKETEKRRTTAFDDRVTARSSVLHAEDPGAGEGSGESEEVEEVEKNGNSGSSPSSPTGTPVATKPENK